MRLPSSQPVPVLRIKRVVSCFILTSSSSSSSPPRVAVFHRQATMPTFPSHWAPCSGSIEPGEQPWETANRELAEETNIVVGTVLAGVGARQGNNDDSSNDDTPASSRHVDVVVVPPLSSQQMGLYVDVPLPDRKGKNSGTNEEAAIAVRRIIRVYPLVVHLPHNNNNDDGGTDDGYDSVLALRGTEHDSFQFVTVPQELEQLIPAVPALATAFHHATRGRYLSDVPPTIQTWSEDRVNGAATLARRAMEILQSAPHDNAQLQRQWATQMRMMRPSMVAITNALNRVLDHGQSPSAVLQQMQDESDRLVEYGCRHIVDHMRKVTATTKAPFVIATFSRSSTLVALLHRVQAALASQSSVPSSSLSAATSATTDSLLLQVYCARSLPGGEGSLMARDVGHVRSTTAVSVVDDDDLHQRIRDGAIDLVLVGADCLVAGTPESSSSPSSKGSDNNNHTRNDRDRENQIVINKVGTQALAQVCAVSNVPIWCFTDSFKVWDDVFPPPLEGDIFEYVDGRLLQVMRVDDNKDDDGSE
jgi:translation initiation factor 2B subunit (eIF-2B alpha/beta/delta family)/8-oxo-dGTP pyrophosphatase MutT (NUDIX family)